jgi:DNA-binding NarL/FixJ family response regulator
VRDSDLSVWLDAPAPLRSRLAAALVADGISIANGSRPSNGSGGRYPVGVVVVELSQPTPVRQLRDRFSRAPAATIIVVSAGIRPLGARRALRAGASSLVLEDQVDVALAPAVRAAAAGLSAIPADLREAAEQPAFSHREREVLRLAIAGHTNGQIAGLLFLAESTVKSHLSSAYRKLGAGCRKEAATLVLDPDEGLVELVLGRAAASPENGHQPAPIAQ